MQDKKTIWKMEFDFNNAFDNALTDIEVYNYTLREVIEKCGFNNLYYKGMFGYEVNNFNQSMLNERVALDYWDYDDDQYRIVYLKEAQ